MSNIESLQWRYATKHFDSKHKLDDSTVSQIITAGQFAPTSFGLQPFHLFVISNEQVKESLVAVSMEQPQIASCSHLVVVCAKRNIAKEDIVAHFDALASQSKNENNSLLNYRDFIIEHISSWPEQARFDWAKRQAYIVLGVMISAASELRVDNCPMEGFDSEQYQQVLGIDAKLTPSAILALGKRSNQDKYALVKKFRYPIDQLATFIA